MYRKVLCSELAKIIIPITILYVLTKQKNYINLNDFFMNHVNFYIEKLNSFKSNSLKLLYVLHVVIHRI